jgi:hypothetical protein
VGDELGEDAGEGPDVVLVAGAAGGEGLGGAVEEPGGEEAPAARDAVAAGGAHVVRVGGGVDGREGEVGEVDVAVPVQQAVGCFDGWCGGRSADGAGNSGSE